MSRKRIVYKLILETWDNPGGDANPENTRDGLAESIREVIYVNHARRVKLIPMRETELREVVTWRRGDADRRVPAEDDVAAPDSLTTSDATASSAPVGFDLAAHHKAPWRPQP